MKDVYKKPVKARKGSKAKNPTVSVAVKQEIKKQISKATENKLCMINGKADTSVGSSYSEYIIPKVGDGYDLRGLLPRIQEGTEGFERVGNSITPKVLKVKGIITYDWPVPKSHDYTVRLMVLTSKLVKDQDELTVVGNQYTKTLLWNGQAAAPVPYLGCQPYYNTLPVNRRAWNVLFDKQIHLRKGLGVLAGEETNPSQQEVFCSPTRAVPFEFILTQKHLPAKLLYQDPSESVPTNFAPVLAMGWCDNTLATSVGDDTHDSDVAIQWTSSLIYEDA